MRSLRYIFDQHTEAIIDRVVQTDAMGPRKPNQKAVAAKEKLAVREQEKATGRARDQEKIDAADWRKV